MTPVWMGMHGQEPMLWAVCVSLESFHVRRRAATGVWLECGVSTSKRSDFSSCPLIRESENKSKRISGQNNLKLFLSDLK